MAVLRGRARGVVRWVWPACLSTRQVCGLVGCADKLASCGDERFLDLNCERGAILMLIARRLSTGRAVGIDLRRSADQSDNSLRERSR